MEENRKLITNGYAAAGMHIRDHVVAVTVNWAQPDERTIQVFARELCSAEKARRDLPVLLFLQGGPGGKGPRPLDKSGWIGEALKTHRVLLLDERGTGRSGRITAASMERFRSGAADEQYLGHFQPESDRRRRRIVLRKTVFGGRKWSTLGQSYGGFLTLTYLGQAPEALDACYITGGLPSLTPDASEVYRRTYVRTKAKNWSFTHATGTTWKRWRRSPTGWPSATSTCRWRPVDGASFPVPGHRLRHEARVRAHGVAHRRGVRRERRAQRHLPGPGAGAQQLRGEPAVCRDAGEHLRGRRQRCNRLGRAAGTRAAPGFRGVRPPADDDRRDDVPVDV